MNIGKLNRRVSLLKRFVTRDEYGGEVTDWKTVGRVWANVAPEYGIEYLQSQQVTAETIVKITLRYNPEITVENRIEYNGKLYEIVGVMDEDTGHRATILNCKEMVSNELQRKNEEGSR